MHTCHECPIDVPYLNYHNWQINTDGRWDDQRQNGYLHIVPMLGDVKQPDDGNDATC